MRVLTTRFRILAALLFISLLVLSLSHRAFASDAEATEDSPQTGTEAAKTIRPDEKVVHPVWAEIQVLLDAQNARLAQLNAAIESTEDTDEIIQLQREIEEVKMTTEIEFFRVQLRYAEKIGNVEAAESLQEVIDGITTRLKVKEARAAEPQDTQR